MTLETILSFVADAFSAHGAVHVAVGAVSHHWGEVLTKHWKVVITWRG